MLRLTTSPSCASVRCTSRETLYSVRSERGDRTNRRPPIRSRSARWWPHRGRIIRRKSLTGVMDNPGGIADWSHRATYPARHRLADHIGKPLARRGHRDEQVEGVVGRHHIRRHGDPCVRSATPASRAIPSSAPRYPATRRRYTQTALMAANAPASQRPKERWGAPSSDRAAPRCRSAAARRPPPTPGAAAHVARLRDGTVPYRCRWDSLTVRSAGYPAAMIGAPRLAKLAMIKVRATRKTAARPE